MQDYIFRVFPVSHALILVTFIDVVDNLNTANRGFYAHLRRD